MTELKSGWSVITTPTFREGVSVLLNLDPPTEFQHILPVRWWQIWRWHKVFSEDYILSQADSILTGRKFAKTMGESLERRMARGES